MSQPREGRRPFFLLAALCAIVFAIASGKSAAVTPTKDVHDIPFYVHEDVVSANPGVDFQAVIDTAIAQANVLLQGEQGPIDNPCCTELLASGTPGATLITYSGLDASPPETASSLNLVNFDADRLALQSIIDSDFGGGSGVFLVDTLTDCSGSPLAIGCASTPLCSGNANDDPPLISLITIDAYESGALAQALAHERGHNACLLHGDTTDPSQLMRPAGGGGSLTAVECGKYQDARITTDGVCACHGSATSILADDTVCTDGSLTGYCSGGTCDESTSESFTHLFAAADPDLTAYTDTIDTAVYDTQLEISGKPGNWISQGAFDNADEPQGLAYSPRRKIVYGVTRTSGDDDLIRIDPATGATLSRTAITGRVDIIALAWDPGPTNARSDDRLLGLDSDGSFETLIEINPDTGAATTIDALEFGNPTSGRVSGMAYDSANQELYVLSFAGLRTVDLDSCDSGPSFCQTTVITDPFGGTLARVGASLAYSAVTENIYMIGNQIGITLPGPSPPAGTFRKTKYNVVRGGTLVAGSDPLVNKGEPYFVVASDETIGLDGLTIGGLAALPAPEPGFPLLAGAALATLAALRSRQPRR